MKQRGVRMAAKRPWRTRALSLLTAMVMAFGLVPGIDLSVEAEAHWADEYLNQMVEWGFMNASQTEDPNRALTRAEFMAVVNRAYGYHEKGAIPFSDVKAEDWFYDDVSIAYTAKYINGTSPTTASPNSTLTREMATAVLGRNMMLKESPGELIDFSDGRNVSNWAVGIVKAATENYLIDGYTDGTFQPKRAVTRAEMAALMTRTVGTPLQEAGEYDLDGVFGNVTITSPGVTLKDTVISGDLYVTGGVGLGDVRLENVTVLGRIIAAGTGVGEKGDVSILMRNVVADELLVDNLQDQYVSLRTDGVTQIGKVTVATSAYLEDNTPQGSGMKLISFEGADNNQLDLAGRIEEVITKTPNATVRLAKGTIEKMTVDEAAPNSRVIIDRGAEIKTLNLDVGTAVSGDGDIGTLNVNAPGSTVTMLPDQINIRPGITATIHGQVMDAAAAAEASRDPMILAGYPVANDVAPTTFNARFMTNKQGTVYWAVSPLSDGSVDAEELINPSSYGSVAVQKGSVASPAADKMIESKVSSLQPGGSYYLSAVMTDGRDDRSPVKVIAFTTPDNTKPAFITGYPYFSRLTDTAAQVTVMPNKNCKLYYIVLPKGASAPTTDQLKANSITGHLGYGVLDVEQNKEIPIDVSNRLEELKSYDLYLWLTDADGANSSNVQKMSFTTVDKTPPEFLVEPAPNKVAATSVSLNFRLNEAGTVYWAAVKEGAEYPKPKPGETEVDLTGEYAKLQVASGMNALKSGKVTAAENKDGTITISGLEQEGAYDVWYVAQDKAGNYSVKVEKITIHTLDENPPVVKQYFTKYNGQDNTMNPMPNTDIVLEFSEGVRSGMKNTDGTSFLDLYNAIEQAGDGQKSAAKDKLADVLRKTVRLYEVTQTGTPRLVNERTSDPNTEKEWVVDYRNVTVTAKEGKVYLTFPSSGDEKERAINLASGATYFFRLEDITDTSTNYNVITPNPLDYDTVKNIKTEHIIPQFTTVFAQVSLSSFGLGADQLPQKTGGGNVDVDFSFRMIPMSTRNVSDSMSFDLLLWTDSMISYDLYYRVVNDDVKEPDILEDKYIAFPNAKADADAKGWVYLGNSGVVNPTDDLAGKSVVGNFNGTNNSLDDAANVANGSNFPQLKSLDDSEKVYYEFAISLTQLGTLTERNTWSGEVNFSIYAAAGISNGLYTLSRGLNMDRWNSYTAAGLNSNNGGASIGTANGGKDHLDLFQTFADTAIPNFVSPSPEWIEVGDTFFRMGLTLSRAGTIYYVVAPMDTLKPSVQPASGSALTGDALWEKVPESGGDPKITTQPGTVTVPSNLDIVKPQYSNPLIKSGTVKYGGGSDTRTELVQDLQPKTPYYVFFVIQGANTQPSQIYLYKFTTSDISKPKITLQRRPAGTVEVTTHVNSNLDYVMFTAADLKELDELKAEFNNSAYLKDGVTLPTQYQTYNRNGTSENTTIIDAMMMTYSNSVGNIDPALDGGYSVFDVYANDTIKTTIANLIRNGASAATGSFSGEIKPRANSMVVVDETKRMRPLTSYYILAVAHHESSKSGPASDTFKAADNVRVTNPATPEPNAQGCSASIVMGSDQLLSGDFTIGFSQPLYWSAAGIEGKILPVYPKDVPNPADSSWISIMADLDGSAVGPGLSVRERDIDTIKQFSSFTFDFKDLRSGSSLILFNGGYICNSSGVVDNANKLQVTISGTITTDKDGNKVANCEALFTWGALGSGKVIKRITTSNIVEAASGTSEIKLPDGTTVITPGKIPGSK